MKEKTLHIMLVWLIVIAVSLLTYLSIQADIIWGVALANSFGSIGITLLILRDRKVSDKIYERSRLTVDELKRRIATLEDHNSYFKTREDVMERVIAIVAHDIRTPIANLNLVVKHFVAGTFGQEDLMNCMQEFKTEINSMLELVNRLLHWVAMNISEAVSIEPINVRREYTTLLSMYAKVALDKGITVVNSVPEKVIIRQDLSHLTIILRNLVDNAIKFTPTNGQIIVGCVTEDIDIYRLFVSNTSVGISNEMIEELVSTNNAVNTRKVEAKSPGLGIFLCKEYLRKLDSFIQIENGPMGFVTFSFNLKPAKVINEK